MEKDIRFTGYTAVPSDYECSDGELTQAYNLINENNHLKPVFQPKVEMVLNADEEVIFVHNTAVFKHYIVKNSANSLFWINSVDGIRKLLRVSNGNINKINAVGNTLCLLLDDGLHYVLWKDTDYIWLGQKPPFVELSFGLSFNKPASYDRGTIETNDTSKTYQAAWRMTAYSANDCLEINSARDAVSFKDKHIEELKSTIWALINQTNALISKEGHFYAPFFVRYCYRMYDGTMWMHSAPVFMPVSMPASFQVEIPNVFASKSDNNINSIIDELNVSEEKNNTKDFKLTKLGFRYRPHNVALTYTLMSSNLTELKNNWGDIVKSIDVFVSMPLVREDSTEQIKTASRAANTYQLELGTIVKHGYPWCLDGDADKVNDVICDIPLLSEEAYLDKIRNVANFYKVHSFNLETDSIIGNGTELPLDKSTLPVLTTQEVMTNDYKSHNRIMPLFDDRGKCVTSLYNYNGRQNIAGFREKLFSGFYAGVLLPKSSSTFDVGDVNLSVQHIYVYINTEDGERMVDCTTEFNHSPTVCSKALLYNCPMYYPDNRAVRMEILQGNKTYVLKMEACPLLNGSWTLGGIMSSMDTPFKIKDADTKTVSDIVDVSYKIYTSEINNPFHFPITGINSIGTGKIYGICSAAKALSQGQFGQFPLYAFTDEGVWSLEINASGGYSAKQPITRDVCISSESITQIDSAVLFATDRGIMEISGSKTKCITDIINGDEYFSLDRLPGLAKLYPNGIPQVDCTFSEYRKSARMAYDYVNQRIIVFNASKDYAYVFSMKSKLWGIVASSLTSAINSYPNAYAMAKVKTVGSDGKQEVTNNCLVDISHSAETHQRGLLVTRPIKLEAGSMLKTFNTVFMRGLFGREKVQVILYGSRDNINWHLIHSAKEHYLRGFRGTPYKYFRIVAITNLSIGETLVGASVAYTPRLTNQIR